MIRTFYTFTLLLLVGLVGCEGKVDAAAEESTPALESDTDKVSYGLGRNIGLGVSQQNIPGLNLEALTLGIADALESREAKVSDSELQAAYVRMQESLKAEAEAVEQEFLAANGQRDGVITTDSGLQYEVLASGDGEQPGPESIVKTHYHGTLIDGSVFDSSVERGQPAEFGVNQVIAGWTEVLQLMKEGDKWKVFVPAKLGYGERSPGPAIPPNSTLIFEVELIEIVKVEEPEDDDSADS